MEPWLAGTNLGLPYWDWSKDWATIPDLWDGVSSPIKDSHAFYSYWSTSNCQEGNKDFSQRINETQRVKGSYYANLTMIIDNAKKRQDFRSFSDSLSSPHGRIHTGLGCSMGELTVAAFDPMFWLHHSFVDKVFADWQNIHPRPSLSSNTFFDPFSNPEINKFYDKTHKSADQSLDYTKNLCYCYDDVDNCQADDFFFVDEHGNRQEKPPRPTPQASAFLLGPPPPLREIINKEFEVYVAVVVPKKVGGRDIKYRVCRIENNEEACSEEDIVTTFDIEIARNGSQDVAINSKGFEIKESLFLPYSWPLSKPTEAVSTWTRIEVLDGGDLIPSEAPPFFAYRFKTELGEVAHLPEGVERQQYGDLLDGYVAVKGYCNSYVIEDLCWDFGSANICGETIASGSTTARRRSGTSCVEEEPVPSTPPTPPTH